MNWEYLLGAIGFGLIFGAIFNIIAWKLLTKENNDE